MQFKNGAINNLTLTGASGLLTLSSNSPAITLAGLSGVPSAADHAVNKAYVDAKVAGIMWKLAARVVSTANQPLAPFGPPTTTVGLILTSGTDRVLLVGQTNAMENGLYVNSAIGLVRLPEFDMGDSVAHFAYFVHEGDFADSAWLVTNEPGSDVVGTDALVFSTIGSAVPGVGILVGAGNTVSVNTAAVVMTTGAQDVAGVKTFTDTTPAASFSNAGAVFRGGVGVALDVRVAGDVYAATLNTTSDRNLKEDISPLQTAASKIRDVEVVNYRLIASPENMRLGVVAQDLQLIFPDAVHSDADGHLSVDYGYLYAALLRAHQELEARVTLLEATLA